jgi:hypothetical protein
MARGDGLTKDERQLLARLDQVFAHQRYLDPVVLASVRAWQRTDRTYQLVQRLSRGLDIANLLRTEALWARTIREHLDIAIDSGRMSFEAVAYRGVRDLGKSFDVDNPSDAVGRRFPQRGYLAATAIEKVAREEFVGPRGALIEITLPVGTPVLWVAGVGHPLLWRQGELLLRDKTTLHVYSLSQAGSIPTLTAKVVA